MFLIFILKENFINERSLESSVNNVFDSGFFMLSLYSLLNFVIVLLCISCLLPNRTRIGSFEEFDTEWDEHLDSINFSEDDRRSVFPFKLSTFFDTESISLSRSNAIFSFFYYFSFFGVLIMYQTAISVYFSFTFVEIMMLTHIQNISEHFLSSWIYLSGFAFIPLICLTIAKPLNRIIGSYFVVLVGSILVFSGWFCMLFLDFKEAKVLGGSLILSGFSISRSALTPLFVRLFEPGPQKYRLFSLEIFIFASRVVTPILLWACGETYISKLGLILSSITLGGLTSGFFCLRPHPSITHHPSSLMCKPSSASEEDSLLDDELDFTHTPTKISPVSLPGVILQHPISYRFK